MAKNPNSRSAKRDDSMFGAMSFFLAGCVAELYLLMIRRCYINGTIEQALAWDGYLKGFAGAGAVILLAGAALGYLWRKEQKKRVIGWAVGAVGVFVAIASVLIRMYYSSAVTLFSVMVPVAMVLCVLWAFYDRECSVALTILCASMIVLWVCRRLMPSLTMGIPVRVGAVVYVLLVAGLAWLVRKGTLDKFLPANADPMPIYLAAGLSALAILVALLSTTVAYYAIWCLGVVVFALAVYYTVKQL